MEEQYMHFVDFRELYINKRNPKTKMYWTVDDAIVDSGIPADLAQAYLTAAQIDHAVDMRIMRASIALEAYSQQVLPILEKYKNQLAE